MPQLTLSYRHTCNAFFFLGGGGGGVGRRSLKMGVIITDNACRNDNLRHSFQIDISPLLQFEMKITLIYFLKGGGGGGSLSLFRIETGILAVFIS